LQYKYNVIIAIVVFILAFTVFIGSLASYLQRKDITKLQERVTVLENKQPGDTCEN